MEGFIYVAGNPSYGNMYKIGKTTRPVEVVLRELSNRTGVPTPFELVFSIPVLDIHQVKTSLQHALQETRVAKNREFYQASLPHIIGVIKDIVATK